MSRSDIPAEPAASAVRLRAITVQQPWAWAIVYGGKRVENRGRREPWHTAVGERIAIHAGKTRDDDGCYDPQVRAAFHGADERLKPLVEEAGTILGTARVAELHHASQCGAACSPWAQPDQWHLVLVDVRPWAQPVAARGALGLWAVPDDARRCHGGWPACAYGDAGKAPCERCEREP